MRYVRKPIEVEAHCWNGFDGIFDVIQAMVDGTAERTGNDSLAIHTLNGTKRAEIGDYVCRDLHEGGVFTIKGPAFKHMYVPADEEEA